MKGGREGGRDVGGGRKEGTNEGRKNKERTEIRKGGGREGNRVRGR